ncbi:MAG TPA: hypothetical protein VFP59_15370 [Candidatus Angelobacter sp.]|nr:hypothetical protein [Candidatus Angelobacter sp.]
MTPQISDPLPVTAAHKGKWWIAAGIFLVTLAVYFLSSAGRIDIIDGQARYEVAYRWIVEGRPVLRDPWIGFMGRPGRHGLRYSSYGAPASVFAMPLVRVGLMHDGPAHETSRFLFSLTSAIFGAGIAFILFLFYLDLGLPSSHALAWTLVSTFATLLWPASTSTFDNAQHAFFVILAAYLGVVAARRNSKILAFAAGLAGAVLIAYQEYFLLLIPAIALCTVQWSVSQQRVDVPNGSFRIFSAIRDDLKDLMSLVRAALSEPGNARRSLTRFLICFGTATVIGVLLCMAYNHLRFGSIWQDGKKPLTPFPPLFGNPISGLGTLLLSPGKSIFLYSPPIILGILGLRYLRSARHEIAVATAAASAILVAFISFIAFAGGDWCWGPRYLVSVLPLWSLAFPFVLGHKLKRESVVAIVAVGVLVQVLALSVENQRFFFERGLRDFFWAEDPWFYFKHSALFARIGEVLSLSHPLPATARFFNSVPKPDWTTYSILGPPPNVPRALAPQWMQFFKIYYLPRPWPLWMSWVKPALRPINLQAWVTALFSLAALGSGFIYHGIRSRETQDVRQYKFEQETECR